MWLIDWSEIRRFACVLVTLIHFVIYVMCVRVRSCHVSGCAQDYSVWYESRYDVSARDETQTKIWWSFCVLFHWRSLQLSLTATLTCIVRAASRDLSSSWPECDTRKISRLRCHIPKRVSQTFIFQKMKTTWSSDADIASVKTVYAVSSLDQWKFCMCHKRLYECHATNIHQCFPWRRHSQADLGIPSSPSFDTKSFHDHDCAWEQDHLGRIDTGFHERFLSYSPSQVQFTIFRAQTFILWQKTTISCESPPEFPLKVQMTKYILPLLMFF